MLHFFDSGEQRVHLPGAAFRLALIFQVNVDHRGQALRQIRNLHVGDDGHASATLLAARRLPFSSFEISAFSVLYQSWQTGSRKIRAFWIG